MPPLLAFGPNDSVYCFCLAYQATGCPTPALEGKRTLHYILRLLLRGLERPQGDCLSTNQAAWVMGAVKAGTYMGMGSHRDRK